jgi:GT2 family glycosyltransferase
MASPKVAIIISTFNQEKLLEKCLSSLKNKTDYKDYKVYFVDDSGKGLIGKRIKNKFKWIDLTINKNNLGFSKSNNVGIKKAIKEYSPEYVLLLNDDCEIVERDWLKNMIEVGEKNNEVGILSCKIIYPDGELQNIGGYLGKWKIIKELNEKKDNFEVDHVMGAFMLIKKKVIEDIGLLDEAFTPYLLEDTDYCLRAKKKGFKIMSVPTIKMIHNKGKSIDSIDVEKRMSVRFKNDILFSKKYFKGFSKFFRIFIYLPMVAIFQKKDEAELKIKNFKIRKNFIKNLRVYFKALFKK